MKVFFPHKLIAAGLAAAALGLGAAAYALPVSAQTPAVDMDDPLAVLSVLEESYGICGARETFELHRTLPAAYGTVYRFRRKGETGDSLILSADREGRILSVNYDPVLHASSPQDEGLTVNSVQTDGLGNETELPIDLTGGVYSLSDGLRNIYTFNMMNGTLLSGRRQLYTSDSGVFSDGLAVSAYASVLKAYDFYADADNIGVSYLGVDGGNDTVADNARERGESSVYILMHYSQNYQNANFTYDDVMDAALLCIGDGSESGDIYQQARATDVVAHEYQHAVTQFTAGLTYLNESGAINEAVSDIFGALIEGHDPCEKEFWETGENAVPDGQGPLRSAIVPNSSTRFNYQRKYPLCYRLHSHGDCDSGGVHYNSGILTHLQYTLWRHAPAFFTRQRIGTLWFTTLLSLTSNATFAEFGRELRGAAERLGYPDSVLCLIDDCLFASGITAAENFHTVTFLDADGGLLDEICVRNGTAPILPAAPKKESNPIHDFVFTGWSEDLSHVTADMTVTAQYETQPRLYRVTFLTPDGEVLWEEQVAYGESAHPPVPPELPPGERTDYVFDSWEGGDYLQVRADINLTPSYRAVPCYFVTYLDSGGLPYRTVRVREGESPHEVDPPPKASTKELDFIFTGWDGDLSSVTEDMTVRPLYGSAPRSYTLSFHTKGATFELEYSYGQEPELPWPPQAGFEGWYLDEACTMPADGLTVTGDRELYAKWDTGCDASFSHFPFLLLLPSIPFLIKKKKRGQEYEKT